MLVNETRTEITEKEGFCRALKNFDDWLTEAEKCKQSARALPLNLNKLNDFVGFFALNFFKIILLNKLNFQKYEGQLKRSELNSKAKTLDDLCALLAKMRSTSPSENHAAMDDALQVVRGRFQRLDALVDGLQQNVLDLCNAFERLQQKNASIVEDSQTLQELINNTNLFDPTTTLSAMADVEQRMRALIDRDWTQLTEIANKVLRIPNVEDGSVVHDMVSFF